jgi:hypothetical protein
MAETPKEANAQPETLAETLFYLSDPSRRQELERFRVKYEKLNGSTDLTKRYTSTWPKAEQDWIFEHHTKEWFDGLPRFAKPIFAARWNCTLVTASSTTCRTT